MFRFAQITSVSLSFEFCLSRLRIQRACTQASSDMKVTVRGEKLKPAVWGGLFPLQRTQPPVPKNFVWHKMLHWIRLGHYTCFSWFIGWGMYVHTQLSLFRNKEFCVLKKEFVIKSVQELTPLAYYVHGVPSWSWVWLPLEMPAFSSTWPSYCSLWYFVTLPFR